jgi:hypothetical protein
VAYAFRRKDSDHVLRNSQVLTAPKMTPTKSQIRPCKRKAGVVTRNAPAMRKPHAITARTYFAATDSRHQLPAKVPPAVVELLWLTTDPLLNPSEELTLLCHRQICFERHVETVSNDQFLVGSPSDVVRCC